MWLAWRKYRKFLFLLSIFACTNKTTQEIQNNLILSDTSLQRYTEKISVDLRKIKEFLPQVSSYIFVKNLNIMINLAEITKM